MREVQIPSYRVRDTAEEGGSRRLLLMAAGIIGTLAAGGVIGWTVTNYTDNTIPVIEADSRPIKVRPEDRGGLRVANQDEIIFERRNANGAYEPSGRLGPAAEAPNLGALRAATAPPASTTAPPPQAVVPAAPLAPAETAPAQIAEAVAEAPQPSPRASVTAATTPQVPPARPEVHSPSAQPPAASVVPARGRYAVQLGALDSEAGARSEWERLTRRVPELGNHAPQILRFEREGKPTMWRLRTAGFESREAAGSFCDTVRNRGSVCAVIAN